MKIYVLDTSVVKMFAGLYNRNILEYFTENAVGLGMLEDGKQIGLLLGKVVEGSLVSLDWIYIKEEYRGRGYGMELFRQFYNSIGKVPEIEGIYAACTEDWMIEGFLTECGFAISYLDADKEYETTLGNLIEMPCKEISNVKTLKETTKLALKSFNQMLFQKADISCGAELPIVQKDYLDCSAVYEKNERICAMVLVQKTEEGLTLPFVYTEKGYEVALISLISTVAVELNKLYPPEQKLVFGLLNQSSVALARKLFPNGTEKRIYSGYMECRRN